MSVEEERELFAKAGIDYAIRGLEAYLGGQPEIAAVLAIVPALEFLKSQRKYAWHDLRKNPGDLPNAEQEVDAAFFNTKGESVTIRAFYEDGTMTVADSTCCWFDTDNWDVDEDTNSEIIPEGWWEDAHLAEKAGPIDRPVIAWRYIEPLEAEVKQMAVEAIQESQRLEQGLESAVVGAVVGASELTRIEIIKAEDDAYQKDRDDVVEKLARYFFVHNTCDECFAKTTCVNPVVGECVGTLTTYLEKALEEETKREKRQYAWRYIEPFEEGKDERI